MLSGVCCSGLAVPRDDRPPIDRVRPGADYTSREVTRPGTGRHPRLTVDELADTHDETEDVDTRRARARTPISVPRAETPDDDVLARAVASLRAEDPAWSFAHEVKGAIDDLRTRAAELEAAARADAEYREAADKRIADLEAAAKRTPLRRIAGIVGKVASIGAVTMALTMTARALVSHGRATEHAEAREALLDETVRRLTRVESRAAARDRAISFLAGKLGLLHLDLDDKDSPP